MWQKARAFDPLVINRATSCNMADQTENNAIRHSWGQCGLNSSPGVPGALFCAWNPTFQKVNSGQYLFRSQNMVPRSRSTREKRIVALYKRLKLSTPAKKWRKQRNISGQLNLVQKRCQRFGWVDAINSPVSKTCNATYLLERIAAARKVTFCIKVFHWSNDIRFYWRCRLAAT